MKTFLNLLQYEILIVFRSAFMWVTPLLFFIIVTSLFPLSMGPDKVLLNKAAAGIVWVAALLAILISIGQLFRSDAQEGFLEQLLLSPHAMTFLVGCKVLSYWLTHCLPLIAISPLLALSFGLTSNEIYALIFSLLLGTPILCLLGALGSALMLSAKGSGLLLPVLIMPLYIPTLIFGTGMILQVNNLPAFHVCLAVMGALGLLCLAFIPWLTAVTLRMGVNQ